MGFTRGVFLESSRCTCGWAGGADDFQRLELPPILRGGCLASLSFWGSADAGIHHALLKFPIFVAVTALVGDLSYRFPCFQQYIQVTSDPGSQVEP